MCDAIFARLFQRHNIYHITSDVKHMEMIEKRNDGEKFYNDCEMDKQSLKMGWKEGWMGIFIGEWKTSGTHSASKRWRSTAAAPISVSGGPDARESIIRFHIFFFSLYFFPYFSSPSLSVRSSLYQRSNDRADICVAVIEQHCFGKNLFHGIVRPRCNCAVLMSEEDVRWYRNVSFRMIDDTEM